MEEYADDSVDERVARIEEVAVIVISEDAEISVDADARAVELVESVPRIDADGDREGNVDSVNVADFIDVAVACEADADALSVATNVSVTVAETAAETE